MLHSKVHIATVAIAAAVLALGGVGPVAAGGDHGRGGGHGGGHSHGHGGHGHHHGGSVSTVAQLDGPRGVHSLAPGKTLVTQSNGDLSLVVERRHRPAKVIRLGGLPESAGFANAVSAARGRIWVLTSAGETSGSATLHRWSRHGFVAVADIAAYQATDPDPYDLEDLPEESNPYGLHALNDGTVLVADAAANELLRVWPNGTIKTVARVKPRTVEFPDGLPPTDPEGNPLPPAGTLLPTEAVTTSVTVGADGYWYVGELRGFPGNVGTAQVWRIRPGSRNAVCDPEAPYNKQCQRYADGFTSIVDLSADRKGNLYVTELSKLGWLAMEIEVPGAEVGAVLKVSKHGRKVRELARDKAILPGGTDVTRNGDVYLTGPIFGPGTLTRIR